MVIGTFIYSCSLLVYTQSCWWAREGGGGERNPRIWDCPPHAERLDLLLATTWQGYSEWASRHVDWCLYNNILWHTVRHQIFEVHNFRRLLNFAGKYCYLIHYSKREDSWCLIFMVSGQPAENYAPRKFGAIRYHCTCILMYMIHCVHVNKYRCTAVPQETGWVETSSDALSETSQYTKCVCVHVCMCFLCMHACVRACMHKRGVRWVWTNPPFRVWKIIIKLYLHASTI